jgi:hypothetical protein
MVEEAVIAAVMSVAKEVPEEHVRQVLTAYLTVQDGAPVVMPCFVVSVPCSQAASAGAEGGVGLLVKALSELPDVIWVEEKLPVKSFNM